MRGLIIYKGPSEFDGKPIVAVLVFSAGNGKTKSPALWVLPDIEVKDGKGYYSTAREAARSVCGGCPLFDVTDDKGRHGTACFAWAHALPIGGVLRSIAVGNYVPDFEMHKIKAWAELEQPRRLRNAYIGDPAAVPRHVLEPMLQSMESWIAPLGYTHQWRKKKNQWLQSYCMASVESVHDARVAAANGWGVFRVGLHDEDPLPEETWCPSQARGMSCAACGQCDGRGGRRIFARAHGVKHVVRRIERVIKRRSAQTAGATP